MRKLIIVIAAVLAGCGTSSNTSSSSGSTSSGTTAGSGSTSTGSSTGTSGSGSSGTTTGSGSTGSSSGSTGGANEVQGLPGFTVQVAQEIQYVTDAGNALADGGVAVYFQDSAFLASSASATVCSPQDLATTDLQVGAIRSGGPVVPGTYSAHSGADGYASLFVQLQLDDGGFAGFSTGPGSDVTVTVTRADDAGFAGTFNGSIYPDGGPWALSGSFDVKPCP